MSSQRYYQGNSHRDSMNGLMRDVDSYLNDLSYETHGHVTPQPRIQSLHQQQQQAQYRESDYSQQLPPNATQRSSNRAGDYLEDNSANYYLTEGGSHERNDSYGSNDSYGYNSYQYGQSPHGPGHPLPQDPHHQQTTSNVSNYAHHSPVTLTDQSSQSYATPSTMMNMPTPTAYHQQASPVLPGSLAYSSQEFVSHRSPPGSPDFNSSYTTAPYPAYQHYQSMQYKEPTSIPYQDPRQLQYQQQNQPQSQPQPQYQYEQQPQYQYEQQPQYQYEQPQQHQYELQQQDYPYEQQQQNQPYEQQQHQQQPQYDQQSQQSPYNSTPYSQASSQDYINYYRQSEVQHTSTVSTPSSAEPSIHSGNGVYYHRSISTRKNIPTTIERPKYIKPAPISTSGLGEENEEEIFIPVSPDSDLDDDEITWVNPQSRPQSYQPPPHIDPPKERPVSTPQSEDLFSPQADYSSLSTLSEAFIKKIKALEHVRELFCANEYPESFTGQEAVTALWKIFEERIPEGYCLLVANALMHSKPALYEPIHYSQKSLITNMLYNSPDELYTFDEDAGKVMPTGVLTSLTKCYVNGCEPDSGGCYAPRCPNNPAVFEAEFTVPASLSRQSSTKSVAATESTTSYPQKAWAQRVPKELLEGVSKKERGRQEAINEMIYSEEVYRTDLDTLHDLIVTPLSESNIIENKRRRAFVKEVFKNYAALRDMSEALFRDLLDLQRRYDQKCIPMIGDVLVQHVVHFERLFMPYTPYVSMSEYLVEIEKGTNDEFRKFVTSVEKEGRMRRLAFRHFLLNPVTRMQRYPLLLSAIIEKTDEDNQDFEYLTRCREMIRKIAHQANKVAAQTEHRVEILKINDKLTCKRDESYDLDLVAEQRKLYKQGVLKRKPTSIDVSEKTDIRVYLFDHILLMTKPRTVGRTEEIRIWRHPIPLELLFIEGNGEPPSSTRSQLTTSASSYVLPSAGTETSGVVSLSLLHLGRKGDVYTFFCGSVEERNQWVKAIEDAKAALKRQKRQGGDDVFEFNTLDDATLKVNCTVPFVTMDGERKIAIGTDAGVYFKTEGEDGHRRILSCENVTQLAVMENHHILLVLADKTLKAYPIDTLNSPKNIKPPESISQEVAQNVNFFQVGVCMRKDLLVYKKKKNTSSVFTAVEPLYNLRDPKNEKVLTQRSKFLGSRKQDSWFKKYKDFYIGADASNIHFLKHKLNVVCERGFEIIDLENLSVSRDIPDSEDPQFNFVQRETDLKPLAMYRVNQEKFLLCYNKFAFNVNNRNGSLDPHLHGRPLLCEWECNPENIVYYHPYIIAFDAQFIEIRHVDTGELAQIIRGENIRLTYYSGGDTPVIHGYMKSNQPGGEKQRVFHLSLNPLCTYTNNNHSRRDKSTGQLTSPSLLIKKK